MCSQKFKFIGLLLIIGFLLLALCGCGSTGGMDDGTDSGGNGDGGGTPTEPSFNFSGTVFGNNGNPFSGVSIYVFSPGYTTTTNSDGAYSLNVSSEMHTLLTSKAGYIEAFHLVDLSSGGSVDQPAVLYPSPVTAVNVLATAGTTAPILSNMIGTETASLSIPPQNSGVFQVGSQTGVNSVGVSLINIDLNSPLPAPMPSNLTLSGEDTIIGGKQAPKMMVSIQPVLLSMDTAANLMLPDQGEFTVNRVLRFDPDTHTWQVLNYSGDNSVAISQGGIYGIFYEEQRTAAVRGTAIPGSIVWIGDEMVEVGADGTFFMDAIPVPPSGPVTVVGLGPADPETGIRPVVQRQLDLVPGEESTVTLLAVPDSLSLSTSQITVKSDNSDSALITATVLNSNNAPFAGVDVSFDVDNGLLMPVVELVDGEQFDPTAVTTGSDGMAQVRFSSGTADKSNRTVNVTARAAGLSAKFIPIQITGTAVTIDNDKTNLSVEGGEEATLTVTVQDASLKPIFDAQVNVSVNPPGALSWTTDDGNLRTDVTGQVTLKVSGNQQADEAVLTIDTMGTTATQLYTVSSTATLFAIISPDTDPFAQPTNQELPIVVRAPTQNQVRFSTTFGTWENGSRVIDVNVAENAATARLKSAEAGLATVQVFDVNNPNTSDTIQIAISAPSSEASQLSLQPSAGVIQPSTGDVSNTITLRATVKNATDQVVGGAPVAFSLERTTGGGETISPVIVFTNSQGLAVTTFFSGSLPSGGSGVLVRAQVVGKPDVADSRNIIIGGTAGSVVIGRSTEVLSSDNNTYYTLPMSVIVSDSNGNPVTGAQVTLGAWPAGYSTGFWTDQPCEAVITSTLDNEDINRNLILDPGEDINEDAQLTPPNSAAGNAIPSIVTTDENGVADFDLVYLKASAAWIVDEITATTLVAGSETQSKLVFRLPFQEGDECNLPNSPYAGDETGGDIQIESEFTQLLANGRSESTITATVLNANGSLADLGTVVQFAVTQGGGGFPNSQVITTSTGLGGTATVTYTSPRGTTEGDTVIIQASSPILEVTDQVSISLGQGELFLTVDGPTSLVADGVSPATIRAQMFGLDGSLIDTPDRIEFVLGPDDNTDSPLGGFPSSDKFIGFAAGGTAEVDFTAGTTAGTAVITATMESGASDSVTITIVPVNVGSLVLSVSPTTTIPTDGNTPAIITATVLDTNGDPIISGTPVRFETDFGSFKGTNGVQVQSAPIVGDNGQVSVYLVSTVEGVANITAEAGPLLRTVSVEFGQGPSPAVINVVPGFPEPASINIRGTQGITTSEIQFEVKDEQGQPITGNFRIDYSITSGPNGGEKFLTTFGSTQGDGVVEAFLRSGFESGIVNIRAEYADNPDVFTTAQVAIQGGPPVGEGFEIEKDTDPDADPDQFKTIVRDISGNPVPDGTLISFSSTSGIPNPVSAQTIDGSATTTVNSPTEPYAVTASTTGAVNTHVTTFAVTSNVVFAGTNGGGIYKSTNSGVNWANVTRDPSIPGQNWIDPYVNDVEIDPENSNIVYAATGYSDLGRLYRSQDGGRTWVNDDLDIEGIYPFNSPVLSIIITRDSNYSGTGELRIVNKPSGSNLEIWTVTLESTEGGGVFKIAGSITGVLNEKYSISSNQSFTTPDGITFSIIPGSPSFKLGDYFVLNPKVCVGTERDGVLCELDGGLNFDFEASIGIQGRLVNEIVKTKGSDALYAGTDAGVYKSTDAGANWTKPGSFPGDFIKTLAVHPPAAGLGDVIYAGSEGTGVWISTDSGNNWTQKIAGLGKVIGATDPEPSSGNAGTGTMTAVEVFSEAGSEEWTVILEEPQIFKVIGSATGELGLRYDLTAGGSYTIPGVLSFTINSGSDAFEIGDFFTFRTIRDEGNNIQDLLVDEKNNNLYAITYFDEFDHATGNVYVHKLNSNGTFGTGSWIEANQNLPQFNPPSDTTLFAQHVMAAIPDDSGEQTSPKALLIGGEGINLYKASAGLQNGNPLWQTSKNGLSNLIMTRFP